MIQQLLTISILPILLSSNLTQLTIEDIEKIKNYPDYYEVIGATSGENITSEWYAEDTVIKTHIILVSAIEEALANQGIDPTKIRVLIYYDPIAIRDDLPPRIWNSQPHPNTVSSPWLDLTKTTNISGEELITIRIDATAARVISDLFSESKNKDNTAGFLEIPSVKQSCLLLTTGQYTEAIFEGGLTPNELFCSPKELRKPLISLFKSAKTSTGSLYEPIVFELAYYCQNAVREYYGELHPQLAVKAMQIFDSRAEYDFQWWKEVIKEVEPIQECD